MGGQPYLYNAPVRYSAIDPYNGFNPKAVTQASYAPPPPPKPKQEGPLLNFNRHPDSYLILPGPSNVTPMNPNTKTKVKWTRKIQQGFRVLQFLGAIGALVCVIAIHGTTDNEGWIIRLPPGIDFLFALYGIYHLTRPAHQRPPASSASYHFFALCIDSGLIPFYVFTALLGRQNYMMETGTTGRWRTYFSTDNATNTILLASYLLSITVGSLHLASLGLDLYLVIIFRKIAQLPPDMNPLEDNLTSRRKNKHKYKNSSVTDISDKRYSETPSSRMSEVSKRRSQTQNPLMDDENKNRSSMSFFQSRTGEDSSFSPHNPKTARLSRATLVDDMYQQSYSARTSRVNLHQRDNSLTPSSRRMSAMPAEPTMSKRNSAVSAVPIDDYDDAKSHISKPSKDNLQNDNWFVLGKDVDEDSYDPYRYSTPRKEIGGQRSNDYEKLPHYEQDDPDFERQPLRMNPPTPPPQPITARSPTVTMPSHVSMQNLSPTRASPRPVSPLQEADHDRSYTITSAVSALSSASHYSDDETVLSHSQTVSSLSGAPKGRFYGDLAAAMRGVRHNEVASPRPKSLVGSLHNTNTASEVSYAASHMPPSQPRSAARNSPASARPRPKSSHVHSVSGTVVRKARAGDEPEHINPYGWDTGAPTHGSSPRVVSRSGADFMDAGSDLGLGRSRRDVSGKIAEEGRGGWGGAGLFLRKISGAA